jgi:hypothetical protein
MIFNPVPEVIRKQAWAKNWILVEAAGAGGTGGGGGVGDGAGGAGVVGGEVGGGIGLAPQARLVLPSAKIKNNTMTIIKMRFMFDLLCLLFP